MRRAIPSGTRTLNLPTGNSGDERGGTANRSKPPRNHSDCGRTPAQRASTPAGARGVATPPSKLGTPPASTGRQVTIRRRSRSLLLKEAVRSAVDVCFHFRFRAVPGEALWSATERVWLGKHTFLYWALWLGDIDIPWTVSTAAGAPDDVEQLRAAVLAELTSYWTEQLAVLPRWKKPRWTPLP